MTSYDAGRDLGQKVRSSAMSLHAVQDVNSVATGVGLSKILGGKQNIGEKVVINDESMVVYQLLEGAHPCCSPKSTPISVAMDFKTAFLSL